MTRRHSCTCCKIPDPAPWIWLKRALTSTSGRLTKDGTEPKRQPHANTRQCDHQKPTKETTTSSTCQLNPNFAPSQLRDGHINGSPRSMHPGSLQRGAHFSPREEEQSPLETVPLSKGYGTLEAAPFPACLCKLRGPMDAQIEHHFENHA